MFGSKLMDMLGSLSNKELKKFSEYVYSPLFNKNNKLLSFIDYIVENSSNYQSEAYSKSKVHEKLFPGEAYNDQKVRDMMSYMSRLLEDFLAYQSITDDPVRVKMYLLKSLRERGLNKDFEKLERETRKALSSENITRDSSLYFNLYRLEHESYHQIMQTEEGMEKDMSIQRMLDNLDRYYLFVKLKYSADLIAQKSNYAKELKLNMLDNILQYLDNHISQFSHNPSILIYHQVIHMVLQNSEEHYRNFIDLLNKYEHLFPKDELWLFYTTAQNFCANKINIGESKYFKEVFNLYKKQLKLGMLFDGKHLPTNTYNNIISSGLQQKEMEWTKNFIEQYKDQLPKKHRESSYAFNLARYYYINKQHNEVLDLLQKVEFTDIYYNLGAKALLVRIYYELNEFEPLSSLLNAFSIYLKRNKTLSEARQTGHSEFIKMTRRLSNIKSSLVASVYTPENISAKISDLIKELKESTNVVNKDWLLNSANELQKLVK